MRHQCRWAALLLQHPRQEDTPQQASFGLLCLLGSTAPVQRVCLCFLGGGRALKQTWFIRLVLAASSVVFDKKTAEITWSSSTSCAALSAARFSTGSPTCTLRAHSHCEQDNKTDIDSDIRASSSTMTTLYLPGAQRSRRLWFSSARAMTPEMSAAVVVLEHWYGSTMSTARC